MREETVEPTVCPPPSDGHCWHWQRGYQLMVNPPIDVDEFKCCWCGGKKTVKYRTAFPGMASDRDHGNHV